MDYHDFFGSIPHAGSIEELTRNIHDERINYYIRQFVNAFDGEYGLGLGSETSQIGAIYYPNPVDRLVKEQYGIHCYSRYMDDSYIIHRTEIMRVAVWKKSSPLRKNLALK